jgi:hypothetical protein
MNVEGIVCFNGENEAEVRRVMEVFADALKKCWVHEAEVIVAACMSIIANVAIQLPADELPSMRRVTLDGMTRAFNEVDRSRSMN